MAAARGAAEKVAAKAGAAVEEDILEAAAAEVVMVMAGRMVEAMVAATMAEAEVPER